MKKTILINVGAAEMRTAILEDGRLQALFLDPLIGTDDHVHANGCHAEVEHSLVGAIFLGRVVRVMPGIQAAFVDIGQDRAGFLGAREARPLASPISADEQSAPAISDCVREGEEVLVQAVKDPIGDKGVRLSAGITIPGRLLVLVPQKAGIAISRRVEDEAERAQLGDLLSEALAGESGAPMPGAGYIIRSAAAGTTSTELRADAKRLAAIWRTVIEKRRLARPPALLHKDLTPIERILRDEVTDDTVRVLTDDRSTFESARAYCHRVMPQAESILERFTGPGALFEAYGLEEDIAGLMVPRVPLPSGRWITIESTEALTAIDVNSGSFLQGAGLEETSLNVNLEAASEIARQLRLRGIGGLIVVDFIHLDDHTNIERLLARLTESLARDHTPTQISRMSKFGLVEITRKRVRDPLAKLWTERCDACSGDGRRRTPQMVAFDALRAVERAAAQAPGREIVVRASPEVAGWIGDHEVEIRTGLARRGAARVRFESDETRGRESYDVTTR